MNKKWYAGIGVGVVTLGMVGVFWINNGNDFDEKKLLNEVSSELLEQTTFDYEKSFKNQIILNGEVSKGGYLEKQKISIAKDQSVKIDFSEASLAENDKQTVSAIGDTKFYIYKDSGYVEDKAYGFKGLELKMTVYDLPKDVQRFNQYMQQSTGNKDKEKIEKSVENDKYLITYMDKSDQVAATTKTYKAEIDKKTKMLEKLVVIDRAETYLRTTTYSINKKEAQSTIDKPKNVTKIDELFPLDMKEKSEKNIKDNKK